MTTQQADNLLDFDAIFGAVGGSIGAEDRRVIIEAAYNRAVTLVNAYDDTYTVPIARKNQALIDIVTLYTAPPENSQLQDAFTNTRYTRRQHLEAEAIRNMLDGFVSPFTTIETIRDRLYSAGYYY